LRLLASGRGVEELMVKLLDAVSLAHMDAVSRCGADRVEMLVHLFVAGRTMLSIMASWVDELVRRLEELGVSRQLLANLVSLL